MAKEIAEEYTSSLADLTLNSKPLINMLTMLADDNIEHAEVIVEAVEKHLEKVRSDFKLPVLYLIDSIVKNVGRAYTSLFTQNIVSTFCSVFEKVDEKVRAQMFKLRQTWNDVFPAKKLYTLDIRVQYIDPAWPITAPQPTPSIHVNPKFFNKPTVSVGTPISITAAKLPLDSTTLDMQTQLINKQKELLELKQKKLELELIQAKAKLEEQQKQLERHSIQIKTPQQILVKSEVTKPSGQNVSIVALKMEDNSVVHKSTSGVTLPTVKPANMSTGGGGGLRIAPVSSALVASVRPALRDPRLLRQQTASSTATGPPSQLSGVPLHNLTTTSNNYENVNIDDKNKLKSKSHNTINVGCATTGNDKASHVNKSGAQQNNTLTRKDPRLLSNKVQGSSAGNKIKTNNGRATNDRAVAPKLKAGSSPSRKSNKSSSSSGALSSVSARSFKGSAPALASPRKPDAPSADGSASSASGKGVKEGASSKSNSDSVTKSTNMSGPSKYKKKPEHGSPRADKGAADQKRVKASANKTSDGKVSRSRDRSADKYADDALAPALVAQSAAGLSGPDRAFKDLKGSTKNRNYMRRNRAISISPEPSQDVDLRIGATPEKQARLQNDLPEDTTKNSSIDETQVNKDVDLRTLVVPAPVNKKRPSIEKLEHTNVKKSKSQMFDVLFGNEDVDLRQLPPVLPNTSPSTSVQAVTRPPTPPPPIISTSPSDRNDIKSKETKSNFDAIRAKLANATKISAISEEARKNIAEDTDMRLKKTLFHDKSEIFLHKIFISPADEQLIKNGNLSQELLEKVLATFETQKLQEAQRQESEEMKNSEFGNTTLTPISDDELSVDFSHSESDEEYKNKKPEQLSTFGDTDDRVPPPAPVISQNSGIKESHMLPLNSLVEQKSDQNVAHPNIDPRLLPNTRIPQQNLELPASWHGHHRRRRPKSHWDSPPPIPGPEPWLRPPPAILNQSMYPPRRKFPFIRPPVETFGPRLEGPVPMIPPHVEPTRTVSPPAIGSQNTKELPIADPLVLEYIEQDTMRTINIDGRPREIRYYDETAVVIMSWDDPREISFQNGTRIVTFDDKESFSLSFNDEYRDVTIGGNPHKIRLGAPTRELYIDGKWYECFFGGPGIGIDIDGKMKIVKMEGPPPHVKIGTVKRTDIVAGKINLIINARTMVPVFLDAKPQKFDIEGKIHTLRFVDALRTVLINEIPFKVEFGGLPKPITVHDKKHFIRFSVLPRGIKPGYVNIANMEGQRFPSPPRNERESSNDATSLEPINNISVTEPALPMLGKRRVLTNEHDSPDSSRNSPTLQGSALQLGTLDVLSSIITSPMANSSNTSGYQIEKRESQDSQDGFPVSRVSDPPAVVAESNPTAVPLPFLPPNLNINELFQKLVASGIVTSAKEKSPPPQKQKDESDVIRPVLFTQPETLKMRQPPLISALYSGMQCSSCGVRFPPEHSMQYSQHLDWHFRQNRRGRNSARKALYRKWYYDVSDWKNFEEIEDIEEREKNWFESQQQQQQAEGVGEDGEEEIEIPSVPAESHLQETCCEVCHDKFEQFYNEEKEEWHLRMTIRIDNKTYHPLCYDDYKASLVHTTLDDTLHNNATSENNNLPTDITDSTENNESKEEAKDGTDLAKEEGQVTLPENGEMKTDETPVEEDDDDVVIEEPKIEQIEIDDKPENDENGDDLAKNEDSNDVLANIVIKQEPVDDDVELYTGHIKTEIIDPENEDQGDNAVSGPIAADTTHAELVSSMDGNVQLNSGGPMTVANSMAGKIKINITKPLLAATKETSVLTEPETSLDPSVDSNQPLPPGEEPVQLNLKPALQGLTLAKQPPVMKGTELTGLCSIM